MRRAGLLTAFPSSKKAFANLHNLNGEVICRVHFQMTCFSLCFELQGGPLYSPSHRLQDFQQGGAAGSPDSRRAGKAAGLQAPLGCPLRLHTASHGVTQHHTAIPRNTGRTGTEGLTLGKGTAAAKPLRA